MNKKCFIADTNVIISALLFPKSNSAKLIEHILKVGIVLVSPQTAEELKQVVQRDKFDPYAPLEKRNRFIYDFIRKSFWVDATQEIQVCRDPKDNMILELAISGRADYIITGDQDLLALNPFREIHILTPAKYLQATSPSGP